MIDELPYLLKAYDDCVKMIGRDSTYENDTAIAMTFLLMERKIRGLEDRGAYALKLIDKCLDIKEMIDNVINKPSPQTCYLYNYFYYPNTMKYLAKYGLLDHESLYYVYEKLKQDAFKARGYSSMADCMNNTRGKAESAIVIKDCIKILQQ